MGIILITLFPASMVENDALMNPCVSKYYMWKFYDLNKPMIICVKIE